MEKSPHLNRGLNLLLRWCSDAMTVRMSAVKECAITNSMQKLLLPRLYKKRPETLSKLGAEQDAAKQEVEKMLGEVVAEARRGMATELLQRLDDACAAFEKCFHLPADFRVGAKKERGAVEGVPGSNYLLLHRSLVRSCINDSRNGKLGWEEQAWLQEWQRALAKLEAQAA